MFRSIALGQYVQRDSIIHSMDPRVKILITVLMAIGLFFIKSFYGFLLVALFIILIIYLARLTPGLVLR